MRAPAVNAKVKAKTIPDLVALAKAKTGTLNYSTFFFFVGAVHGEASRRGMMSTSGVYAFAAATSRQRHHIRRDTSRPAGLSNVLSQSQKLVH